MREARLARPEMRAAADDRGGGGAVVRRSERRPRDERLLAVARARRPSGSASPRAPRPGRAAAGCPAAGARASSSPCRAARRAGGCVRPRRRSRARAERAPARARRRDPAPRRRRRRRRSGGSGSSSSSPRRYATASARCRIGIAATPASAASARRVGRAEQALDAEATCALGNREDAADPPQAAVERELPDRGGAVERAPRQLSRRRQHRQRDRQVEARPLLAQLRGREVDGDPAGREAQLRGGDARANALPRLLAGTVGEADDGEARDAVANVRLHVDPARLEADERMRDRACKHASTLRAKSQRGCAVFVESLCRARVPG